MARVGAFTLCLVVIASLFTSASSFAEEKATQSGVSYYKQIRPIFQAHCQGCHQPAKSQGDYVMTSFKSLLAGGASGDAAVVAKHPENSYLINLITPTDGVAEMPKGKDPLTEYQIKLITQWITDGATDDTPANAQDAINAENPPVYTRPPVATSIDYSPDGQLLAVAGFHEVLIHKADGSEIVSRLVGVSRRIETVRFSPDGTKLAVAGGTPTRMGEIQIWNVAEKKLELSYPITYDTVYGASWSPDGKLVAFGCADNTIRAIDVATGEQVLYQGSHQNWVLDTVFSVEGTHVVSVGRDRSVKLTEVATQRFVDNITSITPGALKGGIASVARHPKEDFVLVGGADGIPQLYRLFRKSKRVIGDNANLVRRFPAMKGRIFGVDLANDGTKMVAVSSDNGQGHVLVCSFETDVEPTKELIEIFKKVASSRSAEERKKVEEYRVATVKTIGELNIDTSALYSVAFHPESNTFAAGGADGKIRLIDVAEMKVVNEFSSAPLSETPAEVAGNADSATSDPDVSSFEPESLPDADAVSGISVQPNEVIIDSPYDTAQLIVTATLSSGQTVDVTRNIKVDVTGDSAYLSPRRRVSAIGNGETKLSFTLGKHIVDSVVKVTNFDQKFHPSFVRDVAPTLTRLGCNAGTCHGANKGKGGFKLSLRGNDPLFDVRAFIDDLKSRRVNFASPDQSLMVLKAVAAVAHTGGQLTRPGEPSYKIIRDWIADGSPLNTDVARVAKIELLPNNTTVVDLGAKQQFRVVATYSDGKVRDVTRESFIETGNGDVAKVDLAGLATSTRRGEAPILARFEGAYTATTLTVMGDREGFAWKDAPVNNKVDEFILAKLQRIKALPSELCTDAEFIRRIYLDITGLPPTSDQVRVFLADKRDSKLKRDELIEELVGSPPFIEHWTNKWADLLQVNRKYLGPDGSAAFRKWIRMQVADNAPYDRFVHSIMTSTGSNLSNPAASYFKIHRTPQDTMENTTHLFMAVRFNCNKCHDHPFEKWTQDQYYETSAFFAQVGLKADPAAGNKRIGGSAVESGKPLYEIIFDKTEGEVKHDRTGQVTPPQFPYDIPASLTKESRREQFADWLTSANNDYFARSYVNRLWGYMLGKGLIEPIDDIRAGNPPVNPELLDWLTNEFVTSGFNTRHIMRTICKSQTYQRSIVSNQWNEDDTTNFSHALARRLPAEVLYDTVHRATGSTSKIPGVAPGTRAAELSDAGVKLPSGFLAQFGRPVRESACECERSSGMELGPVMALISGQTVESAISDPNNNISKLVAQQADNNKIIEEIFLSVLNRYPTEDEVKSSIELFEAVPVEHETLVKRLAELEEKMKPIRAQREKDREERIVAATKAVADYEVEIAPREAELDKKQEEDIAQKQADLLAHKEALYQQLVEREQEVNYSGVWQVLDAKEFSATNKVKLTKLDDFTILADKAQGKGTYQVVVETKLRGITGIRLEALTNDKLPGKGPGFNNGNFVLSEFSVTAAPLMTPMQEGQETPVTPVEPEQIQLKDAQADFSQGGYPVASAINGVAKDRDDGWAVSGGQGRDHVAVFATQSPIGYKGGTKLVFTLDQQYFDNKHGLGAFRLSITTAAKPLLLFEPTEEVRKILAVTPEERTDEQKTILVDSIQGADKQLKDLRAALAKAKQPRPTDPKLVTLREKLERVKKPLQTDPALVESRRAAELSTEQLKNARLTAAQDITWALINSPAFLFNR